MGYRFQPIDFRGLSGGEWNNAFSILISKVTNVSFSFSMQMAHSMDLQLGRAHHYYKSLGLRMIVS